MKKLFHVSALLFSFAAFADPQLTLNMKLNPAGSFQARTEKINSDLVKTGNEFKANKIAVTIETLKTENELRDQHLWKHLNYTKYAQAILTNLHGKDGKATAQLEVAGVKRPVKINYKEDGANVVAEFKVNAKDFKLPAAEYLGIGVDNEIKGEISLPFTKI